MSFVEPEIFISNRHLNESGPAFTGYTTINIRQGMVLKTISTRRLVLVEKLTPSGAVIKFTNGGTYHLTMWKLRHMMYKNGLQGRKAFDNEVEKLKKKKEHQMQRQATMSHRHSITNKKIQETAPSLPKASSIKKKIRIKNKKNSLYGKTGFFVYYNEYQCNAVVCIDNQNVNVALCEIEYIK